jgi:hypothetical protein
VVRHGGEKLLSAPACPVASPMGPNGSGRDDAVRVYALASARRWWAEDLARAVCDYAPKVADGCDEVHEEAQHCSRQQSDSAHQQGL